MLINADPRISVAIESEALPWASSPLPGVERRMLERDGAEVARATSIVRYAPGSAFSAHTHGGGEEFLVLDGVFTDETGDYPAGWYVRNPPGSRHTPSSRPGTTIFVKLRQMRDEEREPVRIDTRAAEGWADAGQGIRTLRLFADGTETVEMIRLAPAATLREAVFPGGAEYLVVEGVVTDEHGRHNTRSWIRLPAGSVHGLASEAGALLWRKTGHLAVRD